jgi:hypothetical protein
MNKIRWHAVSLGAPVFTSPDEDGIPYRIVPSGSWLGVIQEAGTWVYVIGKECTGWVKKEQLALCEIPSLHIHSSQNASAPVIGYIAQSKKVA